MTAQRISAGVLWAYSLPAAAVQFTYLLFTIFYVNYGTDVLLLAPWLMGLLFSLTRIWDAVSDPVAGYLSDRTRSRFGRRRSWMFAAAIPLGLAYMALWNPPLALGATGTAVWVGVALFLYSTSFTAFLMPHEAMGAELTTSYHERTRLFGLKHLVFTLGSFGALGVMYVFTTAEDIRAAALTATTMGGVMVAVVIVLSVRRLKERADFQGRGSTNLIRAFGDVWRNRHARLLLFVFGIENLGTASVALLTPYVMKYIVKAPEATVPMLLAYFVPNLLFPYVWIRVSRHTGKKRLWLAAMSVMTLGFAGLFFVGEGTVLYMMGCSAVLGIGWSCGAVLAPSVKSDVIDYDDLQTGERKEGAYFAVWNLVRKSAMGIVAIITGFALQLADYTPNVEQSEQVIWTMRVLFSGVPTLFYILGILFFIRYSLNESEHRNIVERLKARG